MGKLMERFRTYKFHNVVVMYSELGDVLKGERENTRRQKEMQKKKEKN